MEQTLQALSGILLKAIPTVILLVILHFYLKAMLFKPLQKTLKQREELTAGARQAANESLAAAERKAQDYEAKFRDARAEVYRGQEETRRVWIEDQAKQVAAAQTRSAETLTAARKQLADETVTAKQSLVETSAALADRIASTVLARRQS
ncbi:MAG: ATP synthase F0 subunit B [Bryobacteraceae bacterium]|jgi:F-type H+-transporting ATPase subunit b